MALPTPEEINAANEAYASGATGQPNAASSAVDGLSGIINSLVSSNTGKGAAMGALLGQLLSSYKSPGGVNLGVDMSKLGKIAPRETTVAPRYIPYSQYGAMDKVPQMSQQMAQDFGVPSSSFQYSPLSAQSYSAMPNMQQFAPKTFSAAGSGTGIQTMPTVTPRTPNQISPLTGALMGSALGYLTTPSGTSSTGGSTGGSSGISIPGGLTSAAKNLYNYLSNKFSGGSGSKGSSSGSGGSPNIIDVSGNYGFGGEYTGGSGGSSNIGDVSGNYGFSGDYSDYTGSSDDYSYGFKDGGMATPLMADGGQASYYTYGKAINPSEVLAGMAKGGNAQKGGLSSQMPTIQGRHDYRSGSRVTGDGDGTSDDIPAMLADGEYVFSADVVSALGNGSTKAGADRLDDMVEQIRSRDRSTHPSKLPPDAKSPLQYLKQSRSK